MSVVSLYLVCKNTNLLTIGNQNLNIFFLVVGQPFEYYHINDSNIHSQWAAMPAQRPPIVWAPMAFPMSLR